MKAFACMIVIGKLYRFDACLAQTKITNIRKYSLSCQLVSEGVADGEVEGEGLAE